MKILSRAFIFYGILVPESQVMPWDLEEDIDYSWQECIAVRKGLNPPNIKLKGNEDKFKDYWDKRNKLIHDLGVTVEIYGNSREFNYCFAVKDSLIWASRGFATYLNIEEDFKIEKTWNKKINDFCEILGIKLEDIKPSWHLCTYGEIETTPSAPSGRGLTQ